MSTQHQMNQFVSLLESLKDHHDFLVDFNDCIWTITNGEVKWNFEDSETDMHDGNGETYSSELSTDPKEIGEYSVMNVDDGQGNTVTLVFKTAKFVEL